MTNEISKLFVRIARSVDELIGKGHLIDADFTTQPPEENIQGTSAILNKIEEFRILNENTPDIFPFFKKSYLDKQINAIELQLKLHENPQAYENKYLECVQTLLGIATPEPSYALISELKDKITALTAKLNYTGSVHERLEQWKNENTIGAEEYLEKTIQQADVFSKMTFEKIYLSLLADEQIEFIRNNNNTEYNAIDTTESWSAYNYYKRNYSGLISFSKAGTFTKSSLNHFIAHEGFPGHQASGLVKEYYTTNIIKDDYLGLQFIATPSCLIEEGIANCGLEILGLHPENDQEILNKLNLELHFNTSYLGAYKLFVEKMSEQDVINLLKTERMTEDDDQVQRSLNFIKSWKYYVPSYKLGMNFVMDKLETVQDKKALYQMLYLCPVASIIDKYFI